MGIAGRRWAGAVAALGLVWAVASCDRPNASAPLPPPAAPPLIARADLFGDAVRQKAQLSPRGDQIAFLAPRDGVLNVWVMPVDSSAQARAVTDDQGRGVRRFAWAASGSAILYLQDEQSDENWRLHVVDLATNATRALTPAGARADIVGLSPADPGGVVVAINDRDPAFSDLARIDIATGARTMVQRNSNTPANRGFASFFVDRENHVRLGVKSMPDGGMEVFAKTDGRWASVFVIPFEDAMGSYPLAVEAGGASFLMLDSTGRDRAALVRVVIATGAKTVVGESPRADVVDAWLDPATNAPEAFAADYLQRDWRALDAEAQADLDFLDAQLQGEPTVVSRSLDDKRWIVVEDGPTTPARSYLYDRNDLNNRRLSLLFRHRPALENAPLQPMIPVEIESRDGLTLVSYLTLPLGSDTNGDFKPDAPVPLVLLPHGGPWYRDVYGYNAMHQWLANRGYAALSVNFRGSSGFGKAFLNQGNREWGARMQDDLLDAVQWAVEEGVAQPERIAIMGASYGGYAALRGLTETPERFACGVSYAAPANLNTMLNSIPPFWSTWRDELYLRVGDPRTADGARLLRERSPIHRAAQIQRPLLLALGARDSLSSRADSDAVAQAMRARGRDLIYLVYPDEGHGLARPQNRLSYYAVAEHFLGACLGGRVEPAGAAFQGANLQVFDGASGVPGLSAFARRPAAPPAEETAAPDGAAVPELNAEPAPAEAPTIAPVTPN